MKKQILTIMSLMILALSAASTMAASKAAFNGILNVNTASAEELTQLPGIGKSKAEAIVAYRQAHPFKAVSELTEVKGIGQKLLEKIQSHVTVDGSNPVPKPAVSLAAPTGK